MVGIELRALRSVGFVRPSSDRICILCGARKYAILFVFSQSRAQTDTDRQTGRQRHVNAHPHTPTHTHTVAALSTMIPNT